MKKWLPLLFVATVILILNAGVANAEKATVTPRLLLDDVEIVSDVPPIVRNSTTLVPVRVVTENLGYDVQYSKENKQVTVENGDRKLIMVLDQMTAYINGEETQMTMPPTVQSERVLVPIRFMSNFLGIDISWDQQSKTVLLYSPPPPPPEPEPEPELPVDPSEGESGEEGVQTPAEVTGYIQYIWYEDDVVYVKYDGSLKASHFTLSNPNRIVIDLPNGAYSPEMGPDADFTKVAESKIVVEDHPVLGSIRYSMFGNEQKAPRIVLDLNTMLDYEISYDGMFGIMAIRLGQAKEPTNPSKAQYTVVLDAGHGGTDPGAKSITGKVEKDFNLAIVLKVQALLKNDERINLVLTREDDTFPALLDRPKLANELNADLFVSVHANSNKNKDINGTETYYTRPETKVVAELFHPLIVEATGLKDNAVRKSNLAVTRETTMPAVLLEIGYLSSKIDEPLLWTEKLQNRVAEAIVKGIKQQLKLS